MKTLILTALILSTLGAMAQPVPITNAATGQSNGWVAIRTNDSANGNYVILTNTVPVPVVAKITTSLETVKTILASVLALLTGLLTWWNVQMKDQGSALALLVRHIEALKDKPLQKRIQDDATAKGLEGALSKVVEANTISDGPIADVGPQPSQPPKPVEPAKP